MLYADKTPERTGTLTGELSSLPPSQWTARVVHELRATRNRCDRCDERWV